MSRIFEHYPTYPPNSTNQVLSKPFETFSSHLFNLSIRTVETVLFKPIEPDRRDVLNWPAHNLLNPSAKITKPILSHPPKVYTQAPPILSIQTSYTFTCMSPTFSSLTLPKLLVHTQRSSPKKKILLSLSIHRNKHFKCNVVLVGELPCSQLQPLSSLKNHHRNEGEGTGVVWWSSFGPHKKKTTVFLYTRITCGKKKGKDKERQKNDSRCFLAGSL